MPPGSCDAFQGPLASARMTLRNYPTKVRDMAQGDVRRADVERVRAFNRLVAERVGALSNGFSGAAVRWASHACYGKSDPTTAKCAPCAPASGSIPATPVACCA